VRLKRNAAMVRAGAFANRGTVEAAVVGWMAVEGHISAHQTDKEP
jgi:hypothetical protein